MMKIKVELTRERRRFFTDVIVQLLRVCLWRAVTRTSPDCRERLSADEEVLLGNRARHGMGKREPKTVGVGGERKRRNGGGAMKR